MVAQLNQLIISNIRNLQATDLSLGPQFNLFVGENGSGKTSLLEAIHLLGVGRSFRARSIQQVIAFGQDQCVIRANIKASDDLAGNGVWLGLMRDMRGEAQYRVGEQVGTTSTELTKMLPVQLIDVNSTLLLEGGPDFRRQFIDWGVFHVEHSFLDSWRLMRRALEQRNAALKAKMRPDAVWDEAFVKYALLVDAARQKYVQEFNQVFSCMLAELLGMHNVTLRYLHGWKEGQDLTDALRSTASLDLAYGYTNRGPHRADLEILLDGRAAKTVLSRGQAKIFVCIMLLARAQMLQPQRNCVFLVDDLHAELDKRSCGLFIEAIKRLGCQVFITGIEADLLRAHLHSGDTQMFHVEHGCITA